MERIKNVAALHDLASYGRCSLTCVIPVLSCMGVKVCPIPTAVYSSDTGGFGPVYARELTQEMVCILDKLRAIPARQFDFPLKSPADSDVPRKGFSAAPIPCSNEHPTHTPLFL